MKTAGLTIFPCRTDGGAVVRLCVSVRVCAICCLCAVLAVRLTRVGTVTKRTFCAAGSCRALLRAMQWRPLRESLRPAARVHLQQGVLFVLPFREKKNDSSVAILSCACRRPDQFFSAVVCARRNTSNVRFSVLS